MNNWKEQLNSVFEQLKMEGESNFSKQKVVNNNDEGGDEVNIENKNSLGKKGVSMPITKEDALEDLDKIKKEVTNPIEIIIEVAKVLVRFLATMRSNQLLVDTDKVEIKKRKDMQRSTETTKKT